MPDAKADDERTGHKQGLERQHELLGGKETEPVLAMNEPGSSAGFSLIELMIGLTVLALLIAIGLPSLSTWLQNAQIRTAGETLLSGLNFARNEAVRRNTTVHITLTTTLDGTCAASASGINWVVSLADPTGACGNAPSETAAPQILQAKSGAEGAPKAVISATGGSSLWFNALGRPSSANAANITQIDISNAAGGACAPGGPMRITVSGGGQVKMCDPAFTADSLDPRTC